MTQLFKLHSNFAPCGDQPAAIASLTTRLQAGVRHQVLLGVTGSGKTFTLANVIAQVNRPALVIAPNKTLAAQLFQEFKEFFPENSVQFFISYYDYYQPEAYVAATDTYIAKDSSINDDIDKMRHAATMSLLERRDTIIVASVSCIYGLGSPDSYASLVAHAKVGQHISRDEFLRALIRIQYSRNDHGLVRGAFRVRGDVVDVLPAHQRDEAVRVEFFGDVIEGLSVIDALTGKTIHNTDEIAIYPNSHYVLGRRSINDIVREILDDLGQRLRDFQSQNKLLEFQRLEQRTMADVEAIEHLGYCPGIENYSRYLNGAKPGDPPPTLLEYFPQDFVTIVDESHITVPQIASMYRGDQARKSVLVDFGFRLPAALDNRPLNFEEFLSKSRQIIYVFATPGPFEREHGSEHFTEQLIRPTGLIDPEICIRPAKGQVDDLYTELLDVVRAKGRALVTTLTKKMAEDLCRYYQDMGLKVAYLHSEIDSLERMELLRDLRRGVFDILVGINLLREGLDLPEVRLVAVLDADQEGFLRSKTSLIQIVGRAARNIDGKVIFYADRRTDSMVGCIEETSRRRQRQQDYNQQFNITPISISKALPQSLREIYGIGDNQDSKTIAKLRDLKLGDSKKIDGIIRKLEKQMRDAAKQLEFETAAKLRDEIRELRQVLMSYTEDIL